MATYNEFVPEKFIREEGLTLVDRVKQIRKDIGYKARLAFLRQMKITQLNCRTVLPENWKWL